MPKHVARLTCSVSLDTVDAINEMRGYTMCDQCEVLTINGVRCHETGCPNAWKDERRECAWCGVEFTPEERHQSCCSPECMNAYYN